MMLYILGGRGCQYIANSILIWLGAAWTYSASGLMIPKSWCSGLLPMSLLGSTCHQQFGHERGIVTTMELIQPNWSYWRLVFLRREPGTNIVAPGVTNGTIEGA